MHIGLLDIKMVNGGAPIGLFYFIFLHELAWRQNQTEPKCIIILIIIIVVVVFRGAGFQCVIYLIIKSETQAETLEHHYNIQ